jgi:protocatechuate 3,4-dioxygenase, alpha subunit
MTATKQTPTSSQTVGPYFGIGLTYLIDRSPEVDGATAGAIEIRGKVLDRDGVPVPDAMLEFWSPESSTPSNNDAHPQNFRRAFTDTDGNFSAVMTRPATLPLEDGRMQSPHVLVLIFSRGLLRHLISRVYFADERNETDPVLLGIPAERRRTLIAQRDGDNSFRWNVILQGPDETVFFAW